MLTAMLRLGMQTLLDRWRMTLLMVLIIALPLTGYLGLDAYRSGFANLYSEFQPNFLVAQSSGSMGEFYGSRLPAWLADRLKARGAKLVIPEIHTVTGTSMDSAMLLRGVPLESYTQVEVFRMTAGRALQPGDAPRAAMLGRRLAERLKASVADLVEIRGRQFQVLGIFSTDTYADYEAWVSLPDAQTLLGWGQDVSVYIIRADEGWQPDDQPAPGVSIVSKGSSSGDMKKEWQPLFDLVTAITFALALSAVVALSNLLWRLAWMRRHELAIFRSLGFGQSALVFYLAAQAGLITLLGYAAGSLGAFIIGAVSETRTAGISIHAVFSAHVLVTSLIFAVSIALAASILPVWQIMQLNLSALLRDE